MLILALTITSQLMLGQSGPLNNNPEFTITKRLLSVEDGLASHEVFCGAQDTLTCALYLSPVRINLTIDH